MPDLKSYWQELAKAQGLSDEDAAAVLQALGNEKVAKAFQSGFVERPVFSSELDKTRNEWKSKVDQYDNWYNTQAKPAYEQTRKLAELNEAYRKAYGDLDPANPQSNNPGLDEAKLLKILEERDGARNTGYMRVVKTMTRAAADYAKRFGDVIDVDAFEEFAVKRGGDPWDAYNAFIQPKVAEIQAQAEVRRTQEFDEKLKAAREEGARDALSRRGLPVEVKQEVSPLKSYTKMNRDDLGKVDEDAGHRAFLEEYNKQSAA